MKSYRRIGLAAGSLIAWCGASLALAQGCGGDDTIVATDSGADTTVDVAVPDNFVPPADRSAPDTADTSTPDAADAGTDTAPDVATLTDAGTDASTADLITAFRTQLANLICSREAVCCAGISDAGFDVPRCSAAVFAPGWRGSSYFAGVDDAGSQVFDSAKAQRCLDDIQGITCGANADSISAAVSTALYADCFSAVVGTQPNGGPCSDSVECVGGQFCLLPSDGGAGTCAALRTANQQCGNFGNFPATAASGSPTTAQLLQAQSACSYRGSGNTGLSCQIYDSNGNQLPAATWICAAAVGANGPCSFDQDCTSFECSQTAFTCATSLPYATPPACNYYRIQDAGPG